MNALQIKTADIVNPKRETDEITVREGRLFPYYAGYSAIFTKRLLESLGLNSDSTILDPWNGSGTTTRIASAMKYKSVGCDLNPAMVLIAKADMISSLEAPGLIPLSVEIGKQAALNLADANSKDPLCKWFFPSSAGVIRSIERQIHRALIGEGRPFIPEIRNFSVVSPVAAVMYVGLFRASRRLLSSFLGSNPTWIKSPATLGNRLRPSSEKIVRAFKDEVLLLTKQVEARVSVENDDLNHLSLLRANSSNLPVENNSVDLVLTSPPYCTRIDYAVATAIELAVVGVTGESFDELRRALLGTSTVSAKFEDSADVFLGDVCDSFLKKLKAHPSKASSGYYYKNHQQYFSGLYDSIREVSRVLKTGGTSIFIVQDSYYKEIHNDLPGILIQMGGLSGMSLVRREDFKSSRSMVNVNSRSRLYMNRRDTTESVIFLTRN